MEDIDISSAMKAWLPSNWDAEADIVVCGYGGAGAFAAISAHDAGAEVVLIEKKLMPGGNTVMSEGGMYACNTEQQKALGFEDSPEWMYKYLQAVNNNMLNPDGCRIFCKQSASAIKWVCDLGVNIPAKEGGWVVPGLVMEGNELSSSKTMGLIFKNFYLQKILLILKMAYRITDKCTGCGSCQSECPNDAIYEGDSQLVVDPTRCTECVGIYQYPQCSIVCAEDAPQPDPDYNESREQLLNKCKKLHYDKTPADI